MKLLPLYPELPILPIEDEEPRSVDSDCTRCPLSTGVRTVCMKAEASGIGGILFVSDYPGVDEDRRGRPQSGKGGRLLRREIKRWWKGHVAFDNALRCKVGDRTLRPTFHRQCRGYLAQTVREVRPQRVVLLGSQAIQSFLGRSVPPFSARRGYTWMLGRDVVPVFILMNPAAALRNHFVKEWFKDDLQWALTTSIDELQKDVPWDAAVQVVRTEDDCKQAWMDAQESEFIAYDCETAGKLFEEGDGEEPAFRVLCASFACDHLEDVWSWDKAALADPMLRGWLKRIMEDASIKKVGQNEKYDRHCMRHIGITVANFHADTRLIRKIQDPEVDARLEMMQDLIGMGGGKKEMSMALTAVTKRCRQQPIKSQPDRGSREDLLTTYAEEDMDLVMAIRAGVEKPKKYSYGLIEEGLLLRYNGQDSLSTARLATQQIASLYAGPKPMVRVWETLVKPLTLAIQQVEEWGIHVDEDAVRAFQTIVELKQQDVGSRIYALAAKVGILDFNPDSTPHVRELLFDKLKLRPVKTTPTGLASTDKKSLKIMAKRHTIVDDIMTWRAITKHKGTYADPLLDFVRSDGRVHPSIKIDGARSGRPSCEEPNLFNIPRSKTPVGKLARDCYSVPNPDEDELIEVDFSQLELREAAIESGDPKMIEIFNSGEDYHLKTAHMICRQAWNLEPSQVDKDSEERTLAKSINFAILYGMGPWTLAEEIGCTVEEAETAMNAIMGGFKELKRYTKDALNEARRYGGVWTQWDGEKFRWRPLWRVADNDSEARSRAEHGSWNTKIQGKASDRCLLALIRVVNWILEEGIQDDVKLVLSVYDSLLLEIKKHMRDEVLHVVPQLMLEGRKEVLPIVVDASAGPSWGSLVSIGSYST